MNLEPAVYSTPTTKKQLSFHQICHGNDALGNEAFCKAIHILEREVLNLPAGVLVKLDFQRLPVHVKVLVQDALEVEAQGRHMWPDLDDGRVVCKAAGSKGVYIQYLSILKKLL